MAQVELKQVRKTYPNGAEAIFGVDMKIDDGELIVFVGPSGCGKSTLLRMVAGLESISSGEILIGDRVINDVSPSERDVAMVFQNYALYPHMSVRGNMSYGLKNRKMDKEEIERRITDAATMLKIDQFLDRQPNQLSGGQRQRVAMGRAIVRHPQVFLFDEPLSNLDAKLRVQMRIEIKKLQRRMNVTSIYVTHDQTEAMTLADRLAVINEGQIEQMGAPMELYSNPATLFVASFIGAPQINLIPVAFDGSAIVNGDLRIGGFSDLPMGVDLKLGVRPDVMTIDPEGQVMMNVDIVEQHGGENLIYGTIDGVFSGEGEPQEVCLKGSQTLLPNPDDKLRLRFDPDAAFIFRTDTGERLK
ncbi:sn-glycerol-3-phosphate import ATP-binding protein UgpC [Roseobacter denitrificans]|uniref:sn-glycerol-3-phosphate import ATP-binding protein UgpC n=1 Tax=Roseobacter denitrificans (strain ATCC 33942 / OCh 114) TaxID=375451 RepID=UGPC_ROSDO|nr:sn-glycerol-3-phosphate import ATP-binding protein UgpC [Roseobacter denitrificans]Q164Y5.1 RecName: Full=sn-glycerol-3-phosphate import ATP-binding protein UgpC [Roseobacter denitrificans OCh 114]ABG32458.1 SN-glycerol-3-phosphate ABC transporter, ATP-binding protein [Roseobacter denitrificans OCh 114]AVL51918.1 sn-glycerol-3-phosphate import ATP-binding protein UgpC [Roseobacter denitrificans]SFF82070.1 carbohydrate ABC transporter ATP-binding protein, CUT1 family [Roseobacter denitrifican